MSLELQLLLMLAIIIFGSKVGGHLSQRLLNQPVVFGEILMGLVLGPSLLNIFGWSIFTASADPALQAEHVEKLKLLIHSLAGVGVLLLMFIAGMETDLAQLRRVGRVALWAAVGGVVLPLVAGTAASRLFGFAFGEAVFIGTILTATSVSISAQTLLEIRRLGSKEGTTIIGAAVIDDILGIILLSFVIAFEGASALGGAAASHLGLAHPAAASLAAMMGLPSAIGLLQICTTVVFMGAFFAAAVYLGRRWMGKALEVAERLHASYSVPAAALLLVFLFAVGAEYVGQVAAITGAYIVGFFLSRTRHAKEIIHGIHPFTYALFVPVFLMSIGLGANARELDARYIVFAGVIVAIAIVTKVIGGGIGARLTGFSNAEAGRVGIGMISRGEVGLIVASIGLGAGLIDEHLYAVMVIMVLATTVVTPVLLRISFPHEVEVETEVYESVVAVETQEEEDRLISE